MTEIFNRAWRLARTNPRLFFWRIVTLLRAPVRNARLIHQGIQGRRRIQSSYEGWLLEVDESDLDVDYSSGKWPLLSVIMPVHNPPAPFLTEAISSVISQSYPRWELCICDDASTSPHVRPLLEEFAALDSRILLHFRSHIGHISRASNDAIARACGEFIVLLDHDDVIAPQALAAVAQTSTEFPEADLIYSDEDKIQSDGRRVDPFFKPAWSPTLLTSGNYITHLAALRRELVLRVGGFRLDMVGSQDHDLFLRVSEESRQIAHIPRVLYSWRKSSSSTASASSAKPYAVDAARRALLDTICRRGIQAELVPSHLNGLFVVRRKVSNLPRVSIVVLGESDSTWRHRHQISGATVADVTYLGEYSSGAAPSSRGPTSGAELGGEYVLFVDSDARAASAGSVIALLENLQDERIGIVGGVTTHSRRGIVLQAGLIIGDGGQPHYAFSGLSVLPQANFYLNLKDLPREVSAVHCGAFAIRRDVLQLLDGWDSRLPVALAMCDLCLRAGQQGYDVVSVPLAHFTCEQDLPPLPDVRKYDWRWRPFDDPFWSPHLSTVTPDGVPFRQASNRPRVKDVKPATMRNAIT